MIMDHLRGKFIEEAVDNINELEEAILILEDAPDDKALIERVFRAMHSLKGGGAMFGFTNISEFTHNLETIYDLVRNNKHKVNRELLDITLASIDHLKSLLGDDSESPIVLQTQKLLTNKILKVINSILNKEEIETIAKIDEDIERGYGFFGEIDDLINTFYIRFQPNIDIFNNGTNPLFLIDELNGLGEAFIIAHTNNIVELADHDVYKCYTWWEIYLATEKKAGDIEDVFIFVEDECKVEVLQIAKVDLLQFDDYKTVLNQYKESQKETDINEIISLAERFSVQAKAMVIDDLSDDQEIKSVKRPQNAPKESAISSIRVSSVKLDYLMNMVSEFVTTQARLSLFAETQDIPELNAISENIQKLSRQLRDTAFSICLIPIQTLLTRFQRLVRDLSADLGKEIRFESEGAETELDKTIIESLADPLMHILRNSIDHGIEDESTRVAKGKDRQGLIFFKAYYSGASVCIQISDDGKGLDQAKIREKAIAKGLIQPDSILTKKEIFDLIFLPGFSTAEKVTDVSGRGVGMDVVRRKIADIRGDIDLDSEPDKGTILTIRLPLTISIIDGLLVQVGDTSFIIPLAAVNKCFAVKKSDLDKSYNEITILDGEQVPYINLRNEFNITDNYPENIQIVVVNHNDVRIGLTVDNIVGEAQAVLKPLSKLYKDQDFISGATILGDGTVALVLDTNKIIQRFAKK